MKIGLNRKSNLPVLELDKKDYYDALSVKQMLLGKFACCKCGAENDVPGWTALKGYFDSMRLWIEEIGKSHARNRAKKDLCSNDFSILDGFDIAVGIPNKVVLQAQIMAEADKSNQEAQDAGTANSIYDEPPGY